MFVPLVHSEKLAEINEGELIILLVKDLNNESQPSRYKWWIVISPATSLHDVDLE